MKASKLIGLGLFGVVTGAIGFVAGAWNTTKAAVAGAMMVASVDVKAAKANEEEAEKENAPEKEGEKEA